MPNSCAKSAPASLMAIIRYREDIVDGLEKAPETFIGMLEGKNFGKVIERVRV